MLFGSHIGFVLIRIGHTLMIFMFFLDNQIIGIDTEIGFLSGTVPKLLDIWYFCDYANSCGLG